MDIYGCVKSNTPRELDSTTILSVASPFAWFHLIIYWIMKHTSNEEKSASFDVCGILTRGSFCRSLSIYRAVQSIIRFAAESFAISCSIEEESWPLDPTTITFAHTSLSRLVRLCESEISRNIGRLWEKDEKTRSPLSDHVCFSRFVGAHLAPSLNVPKKKRVGNIFYR